MWFYQDWDEDKSIPWLQDSAAEQHRWSPVAGTANETAWQWWENPFCFTYLLIITNGNDNKIVNFAKLANN